MNQRNTKQMLSDPYRKKQYQENQLKGSTNEKHQYYMKKAQDSHINSYGKNYANLPCAFHHSEKITNFCTNNQCLLPLCPKCVKIHTDEHIKMGIFGQFDTIQQTLKLAEDGLTYSFEKLIQFDKLINEIKSQYQSKIAQERKKIREAKNYYIELIQKIFQNIEKSFINFEKVENQKFVEELYISEKILASMSQQFDKCSKKMKSHQTLMEGVINYYTQADQIQRVQSFSQRLQHIFPETYQIVYHTEQLARTQSAIKKYLYLGKNNEKIWNQYQTILANENKKNAQISNSKMQNTNRHRNSSPKKNFINEIQQQSKNTQRNIQKNLRSQNNTKISELSGPQSNYNLDKFKSPLDGFSLAKIRSNRDNIH